MAVSAFSYYCLEPKVDVNFSGMIRSFRCQMMEAFCLVPRVVAAVSRYNRLVSVKLRRSPLISVNLSASSEEHIKIH